MNLIIINHSFKYETEKLLGVFFPNEKIVITEQRENGERYIETRLDRKGDGADVSVTVSLGGIPVTETVCYAFSQRAKDEPDDDFLERKLAATLYVMLCRLTGYIPPWGILTGVRPAKLMTKLCEKCGEEYAVEYFQNELFVSEEKTKLALTVAKAEKPIIDSSSPESFSLYVSIPFCPSRCSYCSFVSHSNESAKKLMPDYVRLLCREIELTAKIAEKLKLKLASVYIGGGTPTALTAPLLREVTEAVTRSFKDACAVEYTIEAGRPDSITREKLEVIKNCNAGRISINPQTFNDSVLREIGRKHSSKMTEDSMLLARECGFGNINMDIIAGLPTDTLESFENTLGKVLSFDPENVTVHTLALKRSSTMVTEDKARGDGKTAAAMLSLASKKLFEAGYQPYYMYRQSKCLGNLENVGWAKPNSECKYNIYMMEECHTVLAVGAGAVTKLKAPASGEIERIFNYKYPYEYINDFDSLMQRKDRIESFYAEN